MFDQLALRAKGADLYATHQAVERATELVDKRIQPQRRVLLLFDICILSRTCASTASEHCPGHKTTTPRIVVVEEPTHQLSCGIKITYGTPCSIKHLRVCIDAQAAKRKGDTAGNHEPVEGRGVQWLRPIRLGRLNATSALPILNRRIELSRLHSLVELVGRFLKCVGI